MDVRVLLLRQEQLRVRLYRSLLLLLLGGYACFLLGLRLRLGSLLRELLLARLLRCGVVAHGVRDDRLDLLGERVSDRSEAENHAADGDDADRCDCGVPDE